MPAQRRSLEVTGAYRRRVTGIRDRVQAVAAREWPQIEGLDGTGWPDRLAAAVAGAQTEAVRAAAGYLTAYLSSETGRRQRAVSIDTRAYAGVSRDGRPLTEAFRSPLIRVRVALADGRSPEEALKLGLASAVRVVGVDLDHAHRQALTDTIAADDRFTGWERATAGTCGACMALSGRGGDHFDVHPGCNCTPQPIVAGVRDRFPLPSGEDLFAALSAAEQDARFGELKAAALRAGTVALADLVQTSSLATGETDFITEAPMPPDAA